MNVALANRPHRRNRKLNSDYPEYLNNCALTEQHGRAILEYVTHLVDEGSFRARNASAGLVLIQLIKYGVRYRITDYKSIFLTKSPRT